MSEIADLTAAVLKLTRVMHGVHSEMNKRMDRIEFLISKLTKNHQMMNTVTGRFVPIIPPVEMDPHKVFEKYLMWGEVDNP